MTTIIPDPLADDTAPTAPVAEPVITGGWWPDVDPAQLRARYRIRDAVTAPRLREAIVFAIIGVQRDLAAWAADRAAYATLADVPAEEIDGETLLVISYRIAVASAAKAYVVERYRDTDLTGAGQRKVDDLDPSVGELRRDSLHAIRDILGVGRSTIELI